MTDTAGNLLDELVAPADIQDRIGAPSLIARCRDAYPSLSRFVADGGYAGQRLKTAIASPEAWLLIASIRRMTRRLATLES